jgi:hypothetical protein
MTRNEIEQRMQSNWRSWQMEESADRSYDPKMVNFYRDRYYHYKEMLEEFDADA